MTLRPGQIAIGVGGIVLLLASFLDWQSFGGGGFSISLNAWDYGLTGLFLLLIAAVAIAVVALGAFAPQVKLPQQVIGFRQAQFVETLGFAATVLGFSMLFREEGAKIGTILGLLSGAAITVGGYLEDRVGPGPAPAGPTGNVTSF